MRKQTLIEYSKIIAISLTVFVITALFSIVQFYFEKVDDVSGQESPGINNIVVIIDPGHGGEDSGAVGINGSFEKDINLAISDELKNMFSLTDIQVVMTRETDTLLYNNGQENRKKFFDLRNRVELAENYENPIFISIHQNKFPLEKYYGLQVYYSPNNGDSMRIAETIQNNTISCLQKENNRQIKEAGRNIYILRNLECPAVLVECGFLSNSGEEQKLNTKQYQRELAFIIFKSIIEYTAEGDSLV